MWPSGVTLAMTLTLNFQGQIWNLLYLELLSRSQIVDIVVISKILSWHVDMLLCWPELY